MLAPPFLLAAGLALLVTAAGYAGEWHWTADLIAHFRPQMAVAGIVLAVAATFGRRWTAAAIGLAVLLGNAAPLAPYLLPATGAQAAPATPSMRVMTFNLHGGATDRVALRDLLDREAPDVLLLTELPADPRRLVADLAAVFPHHVRTGDRPFDVLLLSRWPVVASAVARPRATWLPVLSARVCRTEAACLTVVGLHAAQPFAEHRALQAAQFRAAAAFAAAAPDPAVLMGDLNLTPWSSRFALLEAAGLRDSGLGRGLSATWLSANPLLGLPIDHVLVGRDLTVLGRRVGPDLGSDHRPLLVDLALPTRTAAESLAFARPTP